jgi:pimeloyl-ACP methyl ester carboxylesterase
MPRAWLWLIAAVLALASPAWAAERWETVPAPEPLPLHLSEHRLQHGSVNLWYATVGRGAPVILVHGGDASSEVWGAQVAALVAHHWRVVLIDSRGHGRSTWDGKPLHYEAMAGDVIAVMDALHVRRAAVVGWSDGAIIALVLAMKAPQRLTRVYAFAANMDLVGLNITGAFAPTIGPSMALLKRMYERISPTPDNWNAFSSAVLAMQLSEPNYSEDDLAAIRGPRIAIVDGDHEEYIDRSHTEYLARTIPGAKLILLPDVGHFAPLEDPKGFNASMIGFLDAGRTRTGAHRKAAATLVAKPAGT